MSTYLLAHDLGTSGNKATLYDTQGNLRASTLYAYDTFYPRPGFVEQDPHDWWKAVCQSTRALLEQSGVTPGEIAAVSFSGQMMGCLLVDQEGEPLRRSIIWADTRSGEQEERMIRLIGAERGYAITGHRLSASYSAAKLLWIRDHEPELYARAYKMLNAKDFIVAKLTGRYWTDYSDASGTNLLDLRAGVWSEEILKALSIPRDLLPELHASAELAGSVLPKAAAETGLLEGTPVVLGGGDGSCACVGAGVVREGKTYHTIGSSSWISTASRQPISDPSMRTFNWVHLDPTLYTPCGTMQAAGVSFQWFRDTLCGEEIRLAGERGESAYRQIDEAIRRTEPGAGGLLYLPYLLGERSPRWNRNARGAFLGLHAGTRKAEMARSVLEGVGYNLKVILDIFDTRTPIDEITVIGGGAKGKIWLQILADIWQKPLCVPRFREEATSLGAAVCAGVGTGVFPSYEEAVRLNPPEERILPRPEYAERYRALYRLFNQAYDQLCCVYDGLAELAL